MTKDQYDKKQAALEAARQAKKDTAAQVDKAVDDFFVERKERIENHVLQKLLIKPLPVGLYKVHWEDGIGNLPDVLSGTYTSIHQAEKAINNYLRVRSAQTNPDQEKLLVCCRIGNRQWLSTASS